MKKIKLVEYSLLQVGWGVSVKNWEKIFKKDKIQWELRDIFKK